MVTVPGYAIGEDLGVAPRPLIFAFFISDPSKIISTPSFLPPCGQGSHRQIDATKRDGDNKSCSFAGERAPDALVKGEQALGFSARCRPQLAKTVERSLGKWHQRLAARATDGHRCEREPCQEMLSSTRVV
jgi:hypothetical protein